MKRQLIIRNEIQVLLIKRKTKNIFKIDCYTHPRAKSEGIEMNKDNFLFLFHYSENGMKLRVLKNKK